VQNDGQDATIWRAQVRGRELIETGTTILAATVETSRPQDALNAHFWLFFDAFLRVLRTPSLMLELSFDFARS
jgi:hypothetical protein